MSGKRRQPGEKPGGSKKGRLEARAELCAALGGQAAREEARRAWGKREAASLGPVLLDSAPFQHCVIHSFIENSKFLEGLKDELLELRFHEKSNDLYKFQQSEDLKSRKEPHISALRDVLFVDFRLWLSEVTGVKLETTVDLSCAQYNYTDTLLCHDDELEGRRFAFILYLVPEWCEADGGALDLYSTDDRTQPGSIVKSLVPCWNTLVFFEVSPISFHQVSEVLSEDKCRLSVSGWFHGPSLERPPRCPDPAPIRNPHMPRDHEVLYEWINPAYLSFEYQSQIQEEFEDSSEISLKDFLKEEKFSAVCAALETHHIDWELLGPPNRRCYKKAKGELPDAVSACMDLLRSEAFFLFLSNLTGLKLHFLAPDNEDSDEGEGSSVDHAKSSTREDGAEQADPAAQSEGGKIPICTGEVRRWEHGHYTMVHDHDPERQAFALDLLLFCGCEEWESEYGGFTSYIAKEEDEELLTVYPENNCLALVYRDRETMRFVKHINHRSVQRDANHPHRSGFWDFAFVYYE
ncbi:prolyl 3-hydroxylase OGFOD1 isoform 2-T2 [Anomaloglossus baeobatrachus]|uniref:prolyl 3-hydroxylase OGFOD1 isoform X2 n=1 Tax=Anomaloglossus baeobatrachus TaxID=238106 RepID=UPI003F4FE830